MTAARFAAARNDHTTLRAFLYRMPKGGDLHTHLAGAVYAERFLIGRRQENLCVDLQSVVVPKTQCDRTGTRPVADAMRDQKLYDHLVNALSMRDFWPTSAVPSGHDEFFATFDRFDAVSGSRFVDMTIDQLKRYEAETCNTSSSWSRRGARANVLGSRRRSAKRRRSRQARGAGSERDRRLRCDETQRSGVRHRQDKTRAGLRRVRAATRLQRHLPLHRPNLPRQSA